MFIEDLTPYFGEFGVAATLNGQPVVAIVDNAFAAAFSGGIAGTSPQAIVPTAAGARRGQTFILDKVTYTVTGVEPDGTGLDLLRLDAA